jgi:8-oxo-dGTP diphosphatase
MVKVTAAIIVENAKILIAKRKPTIKLANLWEFPGGKIESGETPEQCLQRELYEEFEIDVEVGEHLGTITHKYDFGAIELMAFKTRVISGEFILNDHVRVAWVAAKDLGGYEFAPADLPFVDMIKSGEVEL